MKRILMVFTVAGAIGCFAVTGQVPSPAKATPTTKTPTKAPAKAPAKGKTTAKAVVKKAPVKAEPITIPKDAKEIESGTYRWVDPKGVAWIYSQTPFGIMRGPESKERMTETIPTDWEATEVGDSITFSRPWPFGGSKKWTVKKTDLTDMEMAVWQRIQSAKAGK